MKFRDLTKEEIECRVSQISKNGLSLLLYKDARCDMNILDETVGAERWQRKHYECKGNLFCSVGIKLNEWVWKDDCGAESNSEKEKGEASDSFKRACFNWGIGRELYTAPFIWIIADYANIEEYIDKKDNKTKYRCKDKFILKSITIENKKITSLEIYNMAKKSVVYQFGVKKQKVEKITKAEQQSNEQKSKSNEKITKTEQQLIKSVFEQKGKTVDDALKWFKVKDLSEITTKQYADFFQKLNKNEKN